MSLLLKKMCVPLVTLLVACLGMQASPGVAQDQRADGELIVSVTSSNDALEGAIVLLTGRSGAVRLGVTGRDGRCRFRQTGAGSYSLRIVAPAYFVAPENENHLRQVEISPGKKEFVNIELIKGGVIAGRVVTPAGLPLIGLPLTAVKVNLVGSKSQAAPLSESNSTAVSDDKGQFRIYGLRAGGYAIAVNAKRDLYPLISAATFYYKDQGDLANAEVFEVLLAQETRALDMQIDLERGPQSSVVGRVLGEHAFPLEGVFVSLRQSAGNLVSVSTYSERDGSFNFEGLPPGKYVLKAQPRRATYFSSEREILLKQFATDELVLQLPQTLKISGSVSQKKDAETKPLSTSIRLSRSNSTAQIEVVSDSRGRFSFLSEQSGLFWWAFPLLSKDLYVESIRVGSEDVTTQPLKLGPFLSLDHISIAVSSGASQISGRLPESAGDGCSLSTIYAVLVEPRSDTIQAIKRANICKTNFFSLQSLPPGAYHIIAVPNKQIEFGARASAITKFQEVPDDLLPLLAKALAEFRITNHKPIVAAPGKSYEGTIPSILEVHSHELVRH
jgi:hypothetical protein